MGTTKLGDKATQEKYGHNSAIIVFFNHWSTKAEKKRALMYVYSTHVLF